MSYVAISAFLNQFSQLPQKDLLTFVLPGGCNLDCSWCAVAARRERKIVPNFSEQEYCNLIQKYSEFGVISGIAIVGDEPLLPKVWPIAHAMLTRADVLSIPSALITNGTYLHERNGELDSLSSQIIVSIDGIGAHHDLTRRVSGAYDAIEQGLVKAGRSSSLLERITVSSVVQPSKYNLLYQIPEVLARHGIKRWALSPLIQFRRTKPAQLHPRLFPAIYRELPKVMALGRDAGLEVVIDDGLSLLLQADARGELADLAVARPKVPDIRVLRMAPDGTTVRYTDLLDTDTSRALRWDGKEDPVAFYRRLYAANPDPIAA